MAIRIKPANADPETYLRILYQKTETDIINEIFRKRNQGYVDYAEVAALERIQSDLQGMVTESFKYVPKLIEKRFYGDDNPGYGNADAVRGTTNRFMMEMLADNLMGEITETAERAYETSKKLYTLARLDDDLFREAALTSTLYTEALGKGAAISAKFLEATVRSKGVTGFVDKAGRHWSLYAYCNMATRTTARQAEVAGVLSNDEEQDLYRIIPHTSSCAICAPLQGRVYSKSGTNPNYPPLSLAFGKIDPNGGDDLTNTYLNIHPNCLCALVPWTEEGKTEKEIEKARKFSSPEKNPLSKDPRSQKEIEAYRTKEKNRRKKLAELRAKYGREAGRNLPKPLNIPKPQAPLYTVQTANKTGTDLLIRLYNRRIDEMGLHLMKYEDIPDSFKNLISADFGDIDPETAKVFESTLEKYGERYDTLLQKIEPMPKEAQFLQKSVPVGTSINYDTASSTMQINESILKDHSAYVDRMRKAVESGQFPKIAEKRMAEYVPIHEFAHTMMTTGERLPGKANNFAQLNLEKIRKARNEVTKLYSEYMDDLKALETEKNTLYQKVFSGTISESEYKQLGALEKTISEKSISKYAAKSPDEFWGDGFTDALIGESPSEYSKKVLEIANKYFKR